MPQFRAADVGKDNQADNKEDKQEPPPPTNCELIQQHRAIHLGMEQFEKYLRDCRGKKIVFSLPVLKEKMDSWGDVLLKHLDQEVEELGAERMRRVWTLEEMGGFGV